MVLAGPYEFAKSPDHDLYPAQARALTASLDLMDVDLGLLASFEADLLDQAEASPPEGWTVLDGARLVPLPLGGGRSLALILFPEVPDDAEAPSDTAMRAVRDLVEEARAARHDLVVGLSPWGLWVEQAYLKALEADDEPRGVPDILLGSGPGPEMQGAPRVGGRLWWVRAYDKGKSLNRVEVLAWPGQDPDHVWSGDGDIETSFDTLRETVAEDPRVLELISGAAGS